MLPHEPFLGRMFALRVFSCFAGAYLLSYAFRAINAVIAPALMADLALSNADLGLLSSAYFFSFASLQLPLGVWLDKYGARRTESALLLFAAAGAAIFAMSSSLTGLWIGRALIGVGVSACLMAPLKAYRQWYAPERQSQLLSRMLVAGTTGVLVTTVPVASALPYIGWRGVFWIMAALIVLAAAAIYFLLKPVEETMTRPADAVYGVNEPAATATEISRRTEGYAHIFGNPFFRRLAPLGAINQGTFVALQTLWAGPWMVTVLGMSVAQTSRILFVFNACLLLAYLWLSWWAPRHLSYGGNRGWPVLKVVTVGLTGAVLVQAAMLMTAHPLSWLLWLALAGFVSLGMLIATYVSLSFPPSLAGRANSAYNLLLFVGAFFAQWGIGLLIDLFQRKGASPADAIRGALGVVLVLQIASLVAFALNRAQPNREMALP
jgi:MFS family permease